jgi:ABC-2 type transport system ATP-binding protein
VIELALEAHGVSKRYGDREALCGVDLLVHSGTIHGLLGPNGAGKTTLMRVLLGLVRRDSGTVGLVGTPRASFGQPLPTGVAGLVDAPAFYPYLSGRRNLELLSRLDDAWDSQPGLANHKGPRSSVDDVLDQVNLTAHAGAKVGHYSAGMRQRLGIAAALLRSPRLLLLDEPTSSLDPASARVVRDLTRRLASNGTAVVLSSHHLLEIEELCANLTVLNRGRVLFSGAVEKLRALAPASTHRLQTSDDQEAYAMASAYPGMVVMAPAEGGLDLSAALETVDRFVIALGRAGIAVRTLERRERSLESLFLELTETASV